MKNKKVVQPVVKTDKDEKWYEHAYNEKLDSNERISDDIVKKYELKAAELFEKDCQASANSRRKSTTSVMWITQIIKNGTRADKMSAIQLDTQMDPVHSLENVKFLIGWLQKKVLREVIPVLTALKDIFVGELLPENRKLVYLKNRPLDKIEYLSSGNQQTVEKRLILWKFESELKKSYDDFIQAIEAVCKSPVDAVVIHACQTLKQLLSERPEQEQLLLNSLANKLCHPKKIVGSKVSDFLYELVEEHPNMRLIVATEVEKIVFRKNVPMKAQLYAVHFLSRVKFNNEDVDLAIKLLQMYFTLFKILVRAEEENNRMLAIVMIGANRAIPYAKDKLKEIMPEIDSLYKIVHVEKWSIALAALKVLFKLLTFNKELSDRFYSAFYRRLLSVRSSTHDTELFALLEKVILADEMKVRIKAFLKRVLQIALISPPAFAAASLMLYSKIAKEKDDIVKMNMEKNKKFGKTPKKGKFDDSDDEEFYMDVDKIEGNENGNIKEGNKIDKHMNENGKLKVKKTEEMEKNKIKKENGINEKGWLHRLVGTKERSDPAVRGYDYDAKNPLFANADFTVDTELYQLTQHFHPSVAIFAQNIINGDPITYGGDPLEDFTLIRFLDRFAFKNPKIGKEKQSVFSHKYKVQGIKAIGVGSNDYARKTLDEIPIDERYLYHFASMKLKQRGEEEFDEIASIDSDEFEMIMDKFEPGEANEEFEVNFGKMFGPEKTEEDKRISKKRQGDELDALDDEGDDSDEDEIDDEEFMYSDDGEDDDLIGEDGENEGDLVEDGEEEVDDEEEMEDDGRDVESDGENDGFDVESDEDEDYSARFGYAKDALASVDKMDEFMEDEEEKFSRHERESNKRKIKKPKGFKKRRIH